MLLCLTRIMRASDEVLKGKLESLSRESEIHISAFCRTDADWWWCYLIKGGLMERNVQPKVEEEDES